MFLCCGDALFDLFVDSDAYANDIALSGGVGGSPLNVAIGLSRLGHHSRYFTKISQDPFGQRMRRHLDNNRIDTTLCVDTEQNTTLAIVEKNFDGSAKYVFYTDNTADASITSADLPHSLPDDIGVLHVGSYSTVLPDSGKSLLSLVDRESKRCAISYDPNLRLMVEPDIALWRHAFEQIGQHAFFIKASDEDIDELIGEGKYDEFLQRALDMGASVAVVTRGPDGAMATDATGQRVDLPGVKVIVEDTVGAGDTFQAAVLHWLVTNQHIGTGDGGKPVLSGKLDLEACVAFALQAAAITCSRRGADLPSLDVIEKALNASPG